MNKYNYTYKDEDGFKIEAYFNEEISSRYALILNTLCDSNETLIILMMNPSLAGTSKNDEIINPSITGVFPSDATMTILINRFRERYSKIIVINTIPIIEKHSKNINKYINEIKAEKLINLDYIDDILKTTKNFTLLLATGEIKNNVHKDIYIEVMNKIEELISEDQILYAINILASGYSGHPIGKNSALFENLTAVKKKNSSWLLKEID